ncbi:MAG: DNA polymerase IV [Ferruginibacter sp.]
MIAHFDLDSFFVSVEILNNPMLKGKPVIVGGSERGVVAACSYEARKFGIHSAMPSARAKQLCPQAIFVHGTRGEYSRYSRWVTQIIADKAPLFEKASIDEFYIDLTGMDKFFNPLQWTIDLRNEIMQATGLPISFGLSSNKMMAKIATNQAKPNGYLQIPFGKEKEFLAPLPVAEIPGVGKHAQEVLAYLGVQKIRHIANVSAQLLEERLGSFGLELIAKCNGLHNGIVTNYHEAKSISTENTFDKPVYELPFINAELVRFTEKICYELRKEEKVTGCVAVKIRYPNFETFQKQISIDYTSADEDIIPIVKELFKKLHKKGEPIRLLGVRLSDLTGNAVQTNLFANNEKKNDLYKSIDDVKNRFGKGLLKRASSK